MFQKRTMAIAVFIFLFSLGLPCMAQDFSLDDYPHNSLTCIVVPNLFSAEDEFGLWLTSTSAGLLGPSPSLLHPAGPFRDSDHLLPGPVWSFPIGTLCYVDSISANHYPMKKELWPTIKFRFSIDRATGGIAGSASNTQANLNQQPADLYDSTSVFQHPGNFAGTPYPFILPTAGFGGSNTLYRDESAFGLTAGNGVGVVVGPGVMCPPINPGTHDNIDSYNEYPGPTVQYDFFFTVHPAQCALVGFSPSDIFVCRGGFPGLFPPPFAVANQMGLIGTADSIDALIVWDYGNPRICDPGNDYALFSLAPGSATIYNLRAMGFNVDPGTIFFTDFTNNFAIYAYSGDLGVAPAPAMGNSNWKVINLDAMDCH